MSPKSVPLPALIASGGLLFLAGWLASGTSRPEAPDPSASVVSQASRLSAPPLPSQPAAAAGEKVDMLGALAAEASEPESRALLAARLREWAAHDGAAATAWVEQNLQGNLRRASLFNVLSAWGESDSTGAAAGFVLSLQNDPVFDVALQGLVRGWAKSNPAAAGEWLVRAAPDGDETDNAAGQLAKAWAEAEPVAAAGWAVDYFKESGSGLAFQRAIAAWAVADRVSASAFVRDAPDDLQFQGYMQISMAWARVDAPAAAAWADSLESPRIRHGALANIVETWSRGAPGEAAAFIAGIEGEDARATAARFLVGNWVETDMVAASEWLGNLPAGPVRDEAVAELGNRLLDSDPESALAWSLSIRDAVLRDGQIEDLLHSWLLREPETARAWAEANGVSLELLATVGEKLPETSEASVPPPSPVAH